MSDREMIYRRHTSSFRDPSGFVFCGEDGALYRQVNFCYREQYDHLMRSGLYQHLSGENLLITHEEVKLNSPDPKEEYRVLKPLRVPFISYPYEWCFSQLKDAALLTITIQQKAMEYGMVLKDASSYNVQFINGKPLFIDTLSFEKYREGSPWVAYQQFCRQFLAPLALVSLVDPRLQQFLCVHLDGIPLELATTLLPAKAWLKRGLALHLLLHSKSQTVFSKHGFKKSFHGTVSKKALTAMIQHLTMTIKALRWNTKQSQWSDYSAGDSYHPEALEYKKQIIKEYLNSVKPKVVWDIGSNTGDFSRIDSGYSTLVLSMDSDPQCVEYNYQQVKKHHETTILPLVVDLFNPSPSLGWANEERQTLVDRGSCDMILALALVHHIAISNNVPFELIAEWFSKLGTILVVEFVPRNDSKVQAMLALRENEFPDYTVEAFENAFKKYFKILRRDPIINSSRVLYLMRRN